MFCIATYLSKKQIEFFSVLLLQAKFASAFPCEVSILMLLLKAEPLTEALEPTRSQAV